MSGWRPEPCQRRFAERRVHTTPPLPGRGASRRPRVPARENSCRSHQTRPAAASLATNRYQYVGVRSSRLSVDIGRMGDRSALPLQRHCMIVAMQNQAVSLALRRYLASIIGDRAIGNVTGGVDFENLLLVEFFQKVSETQHNALVRNNQHAAAGVVQTQRVQRTAQAQNDIAPTLAAGRPMVELSHVAANLRLLRIELLDARAREPIQNPEFLLSEALVHHGRHSRIAEPSMPINQRRRLAGTHIW